MKSPLRFLLIFGITALALQLWGQEQKPLTQMPASARQLIEIKVTGSKRFPENAIAAATNLQIGTPVNDEDFKKAARILGDTGAFTDIEYSYSYSPQGTKLEFRVTDADKFVPVKFQDFVWFSDADLKQRIKEHVPLFDGELPLSGRMADEVSDVLQGLLVQSAIPGHVDYLRTGKEDGPVESIDFRVSDVLIRIRGFKFTGADPADVPALEAAAQRLPGREYSRARLEQLVLHQLLPVYYARGFLKATFGKPQPEMVKAPGTESEEGPQNQSVVDVVFSVTPGPQYKFKSLSWSGNREFPTATLEKMVHAEPGQPANTIRLGDDIKAVQTLYGSHGFVRASITREMEFDDSAATVAVHLDVKEDYAFHMGDLEFRGLDNSLTAKLRNLWKLRPGDVYDTTYLNDYLPAAQKLLPQNFDWDVSSHVTANVRDKTVDVDLIYSVKATK